MTTTPDPVPAVRLRGVRKSLPSPEGGSIPVLDIAAWELPAGARRALTGASGSGKTTLLSVLAGLLPPDAGSVEIGGTDLATLGEAARDRFRGRRLGLVFQTLNLFPTLTARENLLAAPLLAGRRSGDDAARADALLERVGLTHRRGHLPSRMSLGEQQRTAIARAVMNRPSLLLADEPTGSLDVRRRDEVVDLLLSVAEESGAALLVVTHDAEVAARFPGVLRMEDLVPATVAP